MTEFEDTEITLGPGRLLGLFFALVVVCAVFFALGYSLGRSTAAPSAAVQAGPASATLGAAKPAASRTAGGATTSSASSKAPEQGLSAAAPTVAAAATKPADSDARPPAPAAPPAIAPQAVTGPGFVVQIAAVSKKEDADTLQASLRRKNYPVFVVSDSGDRLFHVQVGPFADRKDAQAMKDRLTGDGYNAIVK